MASNYTPRLGLSHWAGQDTLTMAEFNQNHQRLEERLGYLAAEPLLETTLAEDAATIALSMEGIDWSRYSYVYMDTLFAASTDRVLMRANGSSSASAHSTYVYANRDSLYHTTGLLATLHGQKKSRVRFNVLGEAEWPVHLTFLQPSYPVGWGIFTNVTYSALSTLNFVPASDSGSISAGSKIRLWGVRG